MWSDFVRWLMEEKKNGSKKKNGVSMWQEALLWQSLLVGNSLRYPLCGHSVGERQKGCGGTLCPLIGQQNREENKLQRTVI